MFSVEWLEQASDDLARAWNQADSPTRKAITRAAHLIDQRLETDPHSEGESRDGRVRVTFVEPLVVYFRIEGGQKVIVAEVRLMRKTK